VSFDDDDEIDDVTAGQPGVISDRLLAYRLRQSTMLGHLTDYKRRIEELDVMVSVCYLLSSIYTSCHKKRPAFGLLYNFDTREPISMIFDTSVQQRA